MDSGCKGQVFPNDTWCSEGDCEGQKVVSPL